MPQTPSPSLVQTFEHAYERLNDEQRRAVDSVYGPVMVIAGPGTGKTQIIALRTANILRVTDARPENILITTFTEAGVISIRERLIRMLGPDAYRVRVGTFHSFCQSVIEEYPEYFTRVKLDCMLDDIEGYEIVESLVDSLSLDLLRPIADPYRYVRDIVGAIGRLKQENVDRSRFAAIIERQVEENANELAEIKPALKKYETTRERHEREIAKLRELALVYEAYEDRLRDRGLYDYGDMIRYVAEALRAEESLVANLRERYQYLMIDEYQDTNSLQDDVMGTLAEYADEPNIMVVGDDDQSIYRFQGANIENILAFSRRFAMEEVIVLSRNYRSHQTILDLATESIANNEVRIVNRDPGVVKPLVSAGPAVEVEASLVIPESETQERIMVADEIRRLLDHGVPSEEIAVIVRSNREVEAFTRFLQDQRIAVRSRVETNVFENPFVILFMKILGIIVDPYRSSADLLDVMRSGVFPIDRVDALVLAHELSGLNYTRRKPLGIYDLVANDDTLESLSLRNADAIRDMRSRLAELSGIFARSHVCEAVRIAVELTGFAEYVEDAATLQDLEDVFTVMRTVDTWNQRDPTLSLPALIARFGYHARYGIRMSRMSVRSAAAGVQVLTAHTAKGLEYEAVFVPGLHAGNWGKKRGKADFIKLPRFVIGDEVAEGDLSTDIEEERRLFFVAVTRAKRYLRLSCPMSLENGRACVQSQFLTEISLDASPLDPVDPTPYVLRSLMPARHLDGLLPEEEAYIATFLERYRLSHSDLEKFLEHPRVFLRDVILRYPFEGNVSTKFGSAYHKALEQFAKAYKKGGHVPPLDSLLSTFARALSQELLSPDEYDKLLEKWNEGLAGWYAVYAHADPVALEIEYSFRSKEIVYEGVPISGKADVILPGDTPESMLVIDYKTGTAKTENDLMGRTAKNDRRYLRQLVFYKILVERDPRFAAYPDVRLAIEFVEGKTGKYPRIELKPEPEDIEDLRAKITDAWAKINDLAFWREVLSEKTTFAIRPDSSETE